MHPTITGETLRFTIEPKNGKWRAIEECYTEGLWKPDGQHWFLSCDKARGYAMARLKAVAN